MKGLAAYFFFIFAAGVLYTGYDAIDHSGWVVHNHDTPTWIKGDWLVGEYRHCQMETANQRYSSQGRAAMPYLFCGTDDRPFIDFAQNEVGYDLEWPAILTHFHTLPVRYFGRIDRSDDASWLITWRCQRNSDSLTCKAIN